MEQTCKLLVFSVQRNVFAKFFRKLIQFHLNFSMSIYVGPKYGLVILILNK